MGFHENLARVTEEVTIRRLAQRRAGNYELAEDALQETYRAVARVKDPEGIRNLRAFFCKALIHEINHQRAHSIPIPVEDITATAEQGRASPPDRRHPASVENQAALRLLGETSVRRLAHDCDQLMASVPGRSPDHRCYRLAIIAAARKILLLLLEGSVASTDWNTVLKSEYPRWCDEPGQARETIDQRLSRARRDVQLLLQRIVPREELGY